MKVAGRVEVPIPTAGVEVDIKSNDPPETDEVEVYQRKNAVVVEREYDGDDWVFTSDTTITSPGAPAPPVEVLSFAPPPPAP